MRTHDDSPRLPVRPSLLTQTQQPQADRNRILTTLEGGNTGSSVRARHGRLRARGAMGAATVLLLLGGGVWLGQGGERTEHDARPALPVSLPAAVPAAAAVAAPPAVASIHDETPPAAAVPQQSLSEMLDAGATTTTAAAKGASAAHPGDVLSKALETPSAPAATPKQVARAPRPAARKPPAKATATTPARRAEDSDIALLSALLAHAQAAPAPKKTTSGLRAQLQQCTALKRDAAAACRARACQGHSDNAQCKAEQAAAKGGK